ncbi:hypothetical protein HDF24_07400 [Mucilaginibacter sp. X4EP1]|uniref:hypothetical protein n=1 Tax=Mucilaginibacter sp. X4EP1 TaxID=2723092 RepID=UPI00216A97D1|nr:hypothetical protein [Mucilaginibacter sp. X4EP1]MCS3814137.1 hypothetical protein [Mucilaginibacter sp. X4EP1]
MSKIDRIYVKNSRDELGRYPNWPVNQNISLGNIGYYHGRTAKFEWTTTLHDIGITITTVAPQAIMSELFTSSDSVSSEFHSASAKQPSHAKFTFTKSNSVVTQGFEMGHQQLPIDRLKHEILDGISKKTITWDYDWVIITELWVANGFTTLISGSSSSSSVISANNNGEKMFNIANFNLGLQVTRSKFMAYQGVAEHAVRPYFQIHRLTKDGKFKRYGAKSYFWSN